MINPLEQRSVIPQLLRFRKCLGQGQAKGLRDGYRADGGEDAHAEDHPVLQGLRFVGLPKKKDKLNLEPCFRKPKLNKEVRLAIKKLRPLFKVLLRSFFILFTSASKKQSVCTHAYDVRNGGRGRSSEDSQGSHSRCAQSCRKDLRDLEVDDVNANHKNPFQSHGYGQQRHFV